LSSGRAVFLDQAQNGQQQASLLDHLWITSQGSASRRQGLKPQAIADLETYLRLAPDASDRPQYEQWLRELNGQKLSRAAAEVDGQLATY